MKPFSFVAVYVLFWVLSGFLVLPFGIKTAEEAGEEKVPGQADSAPANFHPRKIILRTTILATLLYTIFYMNYRYDWLTIDSFSFIKPPQS